MQTNRVIYETQADRNTQQRIAEFYCDWIRQAHGEELTPQALSFEYGFDYGLVDHTNRVVEVIEIKARRRFYDQVMLSLSKIWCAQRYAAAGLRPSFIIEMPMHIGGPQILRYDLARPHPAPWPVYFGGRATRQKREPLMMLDIRDFDLLTPVDSN